jgi:cytochrome b subunit of formate dehydrogenase
MLLLFSCLGIVVPTALEGLAASGPGGLEQQSSETRPAELPPALSSPPSAAREPAENGPQADAMEEPEPAVDAETGPDAGLEPGLDDADLLPPIEGSQLELEANACAMCHGESDLWEGEQLRLHVSHEGLAVDVHWRHGVNCHDCHGGDPTSFDVPVAHSTEETEDAEILPFRSPLVEVKKVCGHCHQEQSLQLRKGVHNHAGEKGENGSGTVLSCDQCHGEKTHGMLPVEDSRSPVFLDHQLLTCGGCHEQDLATYKSTVHGQGLYQSGLTVTAVCADCHGAHGIYYAADKRSTLHPAAVADTCGQCHRHIGERIEQSVHGQGASFGEALVKASADGEPKGMPSCTDCHQGHHLLDPEQAPFRMQLSSRCGNCHPDHSSRYALSLHGELTQLGYGPAAICSDCHGAHDMVPIADPRSPLHAGEQRLATCQKCHIRAVQNFSQFDPHANHKDAGKYPYLYFVRRSLQLLFYGFFTFFVVHSLLWFVRSFVYTLGHGQHNTLATGQFALMRYDSTQRFLNGVLFVSFLALILTGLPLKFSDQSWAESYVRALGGYETTSVWHHFFAATAMVGCAVHLVRASVKIVERRQRKAKWGTILFGPDSRLPTLRDGKELFGMGRWFFGLGPRPRFERWTYWEKFDYWAVYLTAAVIGISGLMLWYPNLFCRVLPGEALNVAKVVHEEIAMMAASFFFMFHFYNNHFRPEKFPIDLSVLTGLASEEHLRKYRPEYVERLFREGKLDEIRRPAPSHRRLWFVFLTGATALLVGLCLLALVLVATLGK